MPASPPSSRIADVLSRSLASTLDVLSRERYGSPLTLRRAAADSSPSAPIRFSVERPGLAGLEVEFTILHLGGNVYELRGTIEDEPVRSFHYCLPDPVPLLVPKAPLLAHEIALFLLDALERRLGRELLRGPGDRSSPPDPEASSRHAARPSAP